MLDTMLDNNTNVEISENMPEKTDPDSDSPPDYPSQDAHIGVQKVEAVALVWTKKVVYCTYAW